MRNRLFGTSSFSPDGNENASVKKLIFLVKKERLKEAPFLGLEK